MRRANAGREAQRSAAGRRVRPATAANARALGEAMKWREREGWVQGYVVGWFFWGRDVRRDASPNALASDRAGKPGGASKEGVCGKAICRSIVRVLVIIWYRLWRQEFGEAAEPSPFFSRD